MKLYITLFLVLIATLSLEGQKGREIGGWLGGSTYYGDLHPSLSFDNLGIAGGIIAKINYNSRVSLRGSLSYANISANDADSDNNFNRNRNLSFKSTIWDLTVGAEFNFFDLIHYSYDNRYTPYVFGGFNIFRFNPTAELDGTTYNLTELGTEGQAIGGEYFLISGGFVLGGGFKYAIGNNVYVSVEASTRFLFTDYLDDVSTVYPDLDALEFIRGPEARLLSDRSLVEGIGEEGRQRGDSKTNDRYAFIGVTIMKYFGQIECPKISKVYGD